MMVESEKIRAYKEKHDILTYTHTYHAVHSIPYWGLSRLGRAAQARFKSAVKSMYTLRLSVSPTVDTDILTTKKIDQTTLLYGSLQSGRRI